MNEQTIAPRRRRRGIVIVIIVAVAVAGLAAGYLVWAPASESTSATPAQFSTAQVSTGSIITETKVSGTVQYAAKQPVVSGLAGVVTELPPAGGTIVAGSAAYRVDTRPVIMLSGTTPAWRDFATGMTDGEDVRQLEQNLIAFGFFTGEPDARFTWSTAAAIRAWQKFMGVEQTGAVERASILVSDRELRVDSLDSRLGSQVAAGSPLFQATSLQQVVDVTVKSADRALASVGATVTVTLPTGGTTEGVVESIAAPASKPDADGTGSSIVVPVRISVADQAALAGLALAAVTVSFASTAKNDVLMVPVDALVPTSESEFALELPRTTADDERRLLAVTVGTFASGKVEISGDGVVDGLTVVVPAR